MHMNTATTAAAIPVIYQIKYTLPIQKYIFTINMLWERYKTISYKNRKAQDSFRPTLEYM